MRWIRQTPSGRRDDYITPLRSPMQHMSVKERVYCIMYESARNIPEQGRNGIELSVRQVKLKTGERKKGFKYR